MPTVLRPDPFAAVLLESPALGVTLEQAIYVRKVLDVACSDSRFAEKAYNAIWKILTGGSVQIPKITSLVPNSAEIGDASFILHVHGQEFTPGSIIYFAGQAEPTTFISANEITTGVNMALWLGPDALPVVVLNENGVQSDAMTFTFVDATSQNATSITPTTKKELKKDDKKEPEHKEIEVKEPEHKK